MKRNERDAPSTIHESMLHLELNVRWLKTLLFDTEKYRPAEISYDCNF